MIQHTVDYFVPPDAIKRIPEVHLKKQMAWLDVVELCTSWMYSNDGMLSSRINNVLCWPALE